MAIDNSDIDGAKQVVTRAVEKYNNDRLGLLAHDGVTPIDPPATYQAKVAKALESVEWAVERATALSDKVTQETESQRLAPFSDPTSQLSPSDLQDANLRSRWIAEDCAELPLGDLAERLRAVVASGSKSSIWLHSRYAKRRWAKESAKSNQPLDMDVFTATCRELGVFGERAGLSLEAQKRLEAAGSLSRWATRQLSIARDPAAEAAAKSAMAKEIHSWW